MIKYKKIEKYGEIFLALVVNVLILMFVCIFIDAEYRQPQDLFVLEILSMGEEPHSHFLFYNIIIGKMFQKFAMWIFQNPLLLYKVFQYSAVFVSLTIITFISLRKKCNNLLRVIGSFFIMILAYECYCYPSYMKTAIIVLMSASYLFLELVREKESRKLIYIALVLWGVFGGLISQSLYWIVSIYTAVLLISIGKDKMRYIAYIFMGILLMLFFSYINAKAYENEEWKYVGAYQEEIVELVNYGWPEYEMYEEYLSEEGYTKTEYDSIKNEYYLDMSKDEILNIWRFKHKWIISIERLWRFSIEFISNIFHTPQILISYLYFIVFYMSETVRKKRKSMIYIGGVLIFAIVLYWLKIDMNSDICMLFTLGTAIYVYIQTDNFEKVMLRKTVPYMTTILLFAFMNLLA